MNLDLSAPLPAQQGVLAPKTEADYPTRLVDVKPGSVVRISDGPRGKVGNPITATVLQTHAEFGPTGEPALYVVSDEGGRRDEFIISQAAGYTVTVIASAEQFITDEVPAGAVRVVVRPVHGVAMQFRGGVESATEIIRWALGRGAPRYSAGSDNEPETITFGGLGADVGVMNVGDWVVLHEDNTFHITSDLAGTYDEEI
jgi:hypothetical protein